MEQTQPTDTYMGDTDIVHDAMPQMTRICYVILNKGLWQLRLLL